MFYNLRVAVLPLFSNAKHWCGIKASSAIYIFEYFILLLCYTIYYDVIQRCFYIF